MITRKLLPVIFSFSMLLYPLLADAAKGTIRQPGHQDQDYVQTQGTANLYKPFSHKITTKLFDREVTIYLTPQYKTTFQAEYSSSETATQTEPVSLEGFMVVYDFGKHQKFVLNLHQNHDQAPNDDFADAAEFYVMTDPFFDFAKKKQTGKGKKTVSINSEDVSIYNPFSSFILALLEKLLEYEVRQFTPPSSPIAFLSSPLNQSGQPGFIDVSGKRHINLAFFFPNSQGCDDDDPHDFCLRPTSVSVLPYKRKNTIEVKIEHPTSTYIEGSSLAVSRTKSASNTTYSVTISGAASLTETGEEHIEEKLEELADFLVSVDQQGTLLPAAFQKKLSHQFSQGHIVNFSSSSSTDILIMPVSADEETGSIRINILPSGSQLTRGK